MVKIRIPNTRGHYEMEGFEIDVDDRDIIIRSSHARENQKNTSRFHNTPEPLRREPESENASLLSSIGKISRVFGGKK